VGIGREGRGRERGRGRRGKVRGEEWEHGRGPPFPKS